MTRTRSGPGRCGKANLILNLWSSDRTGETSSTSLQGRTQGKTDQTWFANCAPFLRRTIEIVRPKIIVTLGERAYLAVADLYGIERQTFRSAVEREDGFELEPEVRLFPVYHCGARILNTHRKKDIQEKDWAKFRRALERMPLANAGRPPSAKIQTGTCARGALFSIWYNSYTTACVSVSILERVSYSGRIPAAALGSKKRRSCFRSHIGSTSDPKSRNSIEPSAG